MFINLIKPTLPKNTWSIDTSDLSVVDPTDPKYRFKIIIQFTDGKTYAINPAVGSNANLNEPFPSFSADDTSYTKVASGIVQLKPVSKDGSYGTTNIFQRDDSFLTEHWANNSFKVMATWLPYVGGTSARPLELELGINISSNFFDLKRAVDGSTSAKEQLFTIEIPQRILTDNQGATRKVKAIYLQFVDYYNLNTLKQLGRQDSHAGSTSCNSYSGCYTGPTTYSYTPYNTNTAVEFTSTLITGLGVLKPDAKTTMQDSSLSRIAYKLADPLKRKVPDFKWDFQNASHIFNYWGQTGYYGFKNKDFNGAYLPTNYVGLSDIDNATYVPATKLLDVFTKDNAKITKALPWRDNLVVFTDTTTSMFVGRVPETQQLINANVGVSEKYRNTVQVVSNSIVFKNNSDVFAFVPAQGTDDAESLTVRNISRQISDLLEKTENEINFEIPASEKQYNISSVTYNNDEYWLIYGNKDLGKTTIFKYSWSRYCWIVDEYPIYLEDFIKTSEHQIIASDKDGIIYELLSPNATRVLQSVAPRTYSFWQAFHETLNLPTTPAPEYAILREMQKDLQTLLDDGFENSINGFELDGNGVLVSYAPKNRDIISSEDYKELLRTHFSKDYGDLGNETIAFWITSLDENFLARSVAYELQLGSRRPLLETHTMIDEVTVAVGNESENTITDQTIEIYADNHLFSEFKVDVENNMKAITVAHSEPSWGIGRSAYAKPVASKKTKKIMKMADAVDVHIKGETSNKLFIDGISISYRQTGRKKF